MARKITLFIILLLGAFLTTNLASAQSRRLPAIALWHKGAPETNPRGGKEIVTIYKKTGDHLISNINDPSIIPFIPSKKNATGIALVIAPGGGDTDIWIDHEGYRVAQRLVKSGIAGFVLKYRLSRDKHSHYTLHNSVQDILRAIRLVRSHASEWGINPHKVGVIGFSAGGQIAGLADMLADSGRAHAEDPVERFSSKPDFQALIYPGWINTIVPSRRSSPAFILGGYKDMESISTGMARLYLKFKKLNIPAELHIYANAGHGFGIRPGDTGPSSKWPAALITWLYYINGIGSN